MALEPIGVDCARCGQPIYEDDDAFADLDAVDCVLEWRALPGVGLVHEECRTDAERAGELVDSAFFDIALAEVRALPVEERDALGELAARIVEEHGPADPTTEGGTR